MSLIRYPAESGESSVLASLSDLPETFDEIATLVSFFLYFLTALYHHFLQLDERNQSLTSMITE